jgi:hypothetical protein
LHHLSSNLDLHVLLRLEANLLQALHPRLRGRQGLLREYGS